MSILSDKLADLQFYIESAPLETKEDLEKFRNQIIIKVEMMSKIENGLEHNRQRYAKRTR